MSKAGSLFFVLGGARFKPSVVLRMKGSSLDRVDLPVAQVVVMIEAFFLDQAVDVGAAIAAEIALFSCPRAERGPAVDTGLVAARFHWP